MKNMKISNKTKEKENVIVMTLAFGLFLSMANFAFGQIVCDNNSSVMQPADKVYTRMDIIQPPEGYNKSGNDWTREDFIKNGINVIFAYSYCFDINLKNIEDSFLLYREQFNIKENKILKKVYGRNGSENIIEKYYNANGQIIKERIKYDNDNDRYCCYVLSIEETDYEYDSLHREIKKTEKEITLHYYNKRDTTEVVDAKIDEYVYNSNNQKIEWYHTVDKRKTTTYFIAKRKPKTKYECILCIPRCLNAKWEYDSLSNLTEEVSFSQNNEIQYKKNYFYDEQNRVVKQIDSNKYFNITTTYEYTDTGKIETVIPVGNSAMRGEISYYNNDNKIVKYCHDDTTKENCAEYFYFYENDKLIKTAINNYFRSSYVIMYFYNEKGFLREKQKFKNDKMTELIRYYYE